MIEKLVLGGTGIGDLPILSPTLKPLHYQVTLRQFTYKKTSPRLERIIFPLHSSNTDVSSVFSNLYQGLCMQVATSKLSIVYAGHM